MFVKMVFPIDLTAQILKKKIIRMELQKTALNKFEKKRLSYKRLLKIIKHQMLSFKGLLQNVLEK